MAFGFFNYGQAGEGVSKNGPKKKSFFLFWEIFGAKFWKFFQINLIYVLFCLPVVTFGPATAAMVQLMRKFYIGEPIFVFDEFLKTFKKNFRQAFAMGIIDLILIGLLVYNLGFYADAILNNAEFTNKLMLALSVAMGLFVVMMHFYIYPQIVALNLKLGQIIRNSFILMVAGFKRSFVGLLSWGFLTALMVLTFPWSVIVLPLVPFAWMSYIGTFCAYPVIQKYIIDPYYEARGEKNPEYARYETGDEAVFEDRGGSETPVDMGGTKIKDKKSAANVKVNVKSSKKVIK